MGSLSSVGVALSLIFGFLLLALIAELYYLLWWKKNRHTNGEIEEEGNCSIPGRDLLHMLCLTKPSSLSCSHTHVHEPQAPFHPHPNKALWTKHGPPRLLFTIKEETMEDLESEDGKSTSRRSFTVETPFLTPLASPPYFTPPLSPVWDSSKTHHGFNFNPLFESSPPPNFKILKEAEDVLKMDEENGSFIILIVGNKKERETNNSTISASQLLPLASNNKPITLQLHQVN